MKKRTFLILSLLILGLLPFRGYSQTSAILPVNSISDWENAGVQGGIPEYPAGVNVLDYGAVGNGTTDDTQAILDAIDDCPDERAVIFPAGSYLTTNTLVVSKPIVLRGAGPDQTRIIHHHSRNGIVLNSGANRAGIEDLHVETIWNYTGYSGTKIRFQGVENSWVRNIETSGYIGQAVLLIESSHCEVRDSYIHNSSEMMDETLDQFSAYGIEVYGGSVGAHYNLVENNVLDWFRHAMILQHLSQNNVYAYNFAWNSWSCNNYCGLSVTTDMEFHHFNYTTNTEFISFTLLEGNLFEHGGVGSHNNNTTFRNRINNGGFSVKNGSTVPNYLVGNEFVEAKYPGTLRNVIGNFNDISIVHGNYVLEESRVQWDPAISDHDIPDSYYLIEKPAFFGDLDWPPYGGDLMPGNMRRTPAEVRYWTMQFPEIRPSNLRANVQGDDVILTWNNNSTNDVDFIVCRSTNGTDYQRIGETTNTTYTDKITNTGQYHYYVRARNHLGGRNYYGDLHGIDLGGESDPSNIVAVGEGILSVEQGDLTKNALSIYPNPTSGILNFDFPDNQAQSISIYSSPGKLVKEEKYKGNSVSISGLEKGMYFLVIKGIRKSYHAKFIIE